MSTCRFCPVALDRSYAYDWYAAIDLATFCCSQMTSEKFASVVMGGIIRHADDTICISLAAGITTSLYRLAMISISSSAGVTRE
jgi:hypothetical protein